MFKKKFIAESIIVPIREPETNTIIKTNIMPNLSILSIIVLKKSGAKTYKTRDPSSGGIGNILNTKKPRLTDTKVENNLIEKSGYAPLLRKTSTPNDKNAINKLDIGPAKATITIPHSPKRSLVGLKGTGLAPPKIGNPAIANIIGINIVNTGSICLIGLKDSLPNSFAVSSPR